MTLSPTENVTVPPVVGSALWKADASRRSSEYSSLPDDSTTRSAVFLRIFDDFLSQARAGVARKYLVPAPNSLGDSKPGRSIVCPRDSKRDLCRDFVAPLSGWSGRACRKGGVGA